MGHGGNSNVGSAALTDNVIPDKSDDRQLTFPLQIRDYRKGATAAAVKCNAES